MILSCLWIFRWGFVNLYNEQAQGIEQNHEHVEIHMNIILVSDHVITCILKCNKTKHFEPLMMNHLIGLNR